MRLTTRTNLAARILMFCASNPDRLVRTAEIAEICECSSNHAAHVVKSLQVHGYLSTLRGRTGGISLARPSDDISVGEVFRHMESDIPLAECFDPDTNTCPLISACRLRDYLLRALEAFYKELDGVSLADLVEGNCGLGQILTLHPTLHQDMQCHNQ